MKSAVKVLVALASSVPLLAIGAKPVQPPPPPTVSGMKVYSAGQQIGYVLSVYRDNYGDNLTVISTTGYLAEFILSTGGFRTTNIGYTSLPNAIVYTGTNCSGDAYAVMSDTGAAWKLQQGMVFRFGPNAYYTERGWMLPNGVDYWSSRSADGSCFTHNTRMNVQNAVPAFPNDMAITGIPSEGLSQPIVFGIP